MMVCKYGCPKRGVHLCDAEPPPIVSESLCNRTLCIYRPGIPDPAVKCMFYYNGKVPNTGRLVCYTCGREKD